MRKLILAAALALSACTTLPTVPPAPVVVADKTTLDESGALGVEVAYKAFRTAMEMAVDAGLLKGAAAERVKGLDNRAYALVGAARAAYRAGNALSYRQAVDEALAAITSATAAIAGE